MSKVTELLAEIKKLTLEEQRVLNTALVHHMRFNIRHQAVMKAMTFQIGDIVKFDGKTRGPIYIEVSTTSRDFSKLKGRQLNRGWKTAAGTPWTVGALACTKATREEALKA